MPRILGVDIPADKRIDIALTSLYGVGRSRAQTILAEAKVEFTTKSKNITADEENAIMFTAGMGVGEESV